MVMVRIYIFGVAELKYEYAIVCFCSSPLNPPFNKKRSNIWLPPWKGGREGDDKGGLLEFYSPQNWEVRGAKSYPESATPYFLIFPTLPTFPSWEGLGVGSHTPHIPHIPHIPLLGGVRGGFPHSPHSLLPAYKLN